MTNQRVHAEARRPQRRIPHNVMLEPKACRAQLGSASILPRRPKGRDEKWTLNQVQGDGCGSGRHAVFDDRIEIVRVLHLASDFERWL
jgi:hypothetical protein